MTVAEPGPFRFRDDTRRWVTRAACRGLPHTIFYSGQGGDTGPGKEVCRTCPVIDDCLNYALTNNEDSGIWGGTSERERRRMRRKTRLDQLDQEAETA